MSLARALRRLPMLTGTVVQAERSSVPEPAGKPPPIDFALIYDSFITSKTNSVADRAHRKRGIFHPSSGLHEDTGLCKRQLVFEMLMAPMSKTTIPPRLAKALDTGSKRHVGLQDNFKKLAAKGFMGIVSFAEEVPCKHPWLPLSGHMDGLAVTNAGHRYAMDFKTSSSKKYETTYEPEFRHRVQLNTYMGIAGTRAGYMIYENKDSGLWAGPPAKFRVDFNQSLYDETEAFCLSVLELVANEEMPEYAEKVCQDNVMFCTYCEICAKEQKGETTWSEYDCRSEEYQRWHVEPLYHA